MARERARAVERAIAEGTADRAMLRAIARGAEPNQIPPRSPDLIETVVAEFITRHLEGRRRAPAYIRGVEGRFRNHVLPAFAGRDIRAITRREIIALLDHVHDHSGPGAANLTLTALRKMFHWAHERDLIERVPTSGIVMPGEKSKRDRVLDDTELALLVRTARRIGYPFGAFVQLLVLLGLRRAEVAMLRWDDIDLVNGIMTLPAERMKARRAHVVPLAPQAVELLSHCPRRGPFVLTADGTKPISAFGWAKQQLDKHTNEMVAWRLHDLRRSCATGMARLGVPRFIIARVLAHTDREITGTYDRYEYLTEKRAALEKWAAHVVGLLQPQPVEAAHGR
jgi:integrase